MRFVLAFLCFLPMASGGFLKCLVIDEVLKYAKGKAAGFFDPVCEQKTAPLLASCESGDLAQLVRDVAEQLCYEACEDIVKQYGSIDWIKQDFLPPYGSVYISCVKDIGVALQKDIQTECNAHVHGTPQAFCNNVFCQLYNDLAKAVESKEGCSQKSVC